MSTTFVVEVPSIYDDDEYEEVIVARRGFTIGWANPLAQLLPDETKVIAIDNSEQGIYTIGDIKEKIKTD